LQLSLSAGAATAALCVLLCSTQAMATAVVVHPGDQLLVRVYGHPELSEPVTVNAADQVSLPLAGTVDVHGLGMVQIAERIRKLKLDELRPIEALQLLAELQRELS